MLYMLVCYFLQHRLKCLVKRFHLALSYFSIIREIPHPYLHPLRMDLGFKKGIRIMPRSRRNSPETSYRQTHSEMPMSFENTLRLRNEPDKDLPEAIQRELSTPRIYLHGTPHARDVDNYLTSVEEMEATWSIRLPAGASIGLAGYDPATNVVKPADVAALTAKLYQAQLLNKADTDLVLSYMQQ